MIVLEEFGEIRDRAVMHGIHSVDPFANPATESVFQCLHVLHELVEAIAKLLAYSPSFDVRV